ncbi:hypothetical protein PpBr36_08696 [Pyricularia pennisetigena]|uniref:hypothetical protein n=1 Tax=Pyricularia pennisetigena TaxID=1578925 RepID=UPI00115076C5|nr:hypothetical protein PpBr36_08696 [Pyricularia pennisetigena]TLS24750.1 hypothetical protein PpBr36_08696 [Pyricularia pennisetigena]
MRGSKLIRPAQQLLQSRLQQLPATKTPSISTQLWQIRLNSSDTSSSSITTPEAATIADLLTEELDLETPPKPQLQDSPVKETQEQLNRFPRSLQSLHLQPLRRETEYGIPSCDLQLRAYSARPIEFFSDFALRAAYYLGLPAFGPTPLPRIVQRWTVPRSHFIFKKSQENYERITLRRLIQIRDGHPETVQIWLAFLQKHAYPGVGMKANMWEFGALDAAKEMDEAAKRAAADIESSWVHLGQKKPLGTVKDVKEMLQKERVTLAGGRDMSIRPSPRLVRPIINRLQLQQRFSAATSNYSTSSTSPRTPPKGAKFEIPKDSTVFSGIQPSGIPHLGNYLGALRQWRRLQDSAAAETSLYFSVVDLHAITMPQKCDQLRQWRREALAALLAIGLDPKRSVIFYQSSVPAHSELMWLLSCNASTGYLSRMTQWKSKLDLGNGERLSLDDKKVKAKLKLGLFSYPVLQAADVLVHRATHVPVGEDQAQHLEFARECATNFNAIYGKQLVAPETIICKVYNLSVLSAQLVVAHVYNGVADTHSPPATLCQQQKNNTAPTSKVMSLRDPTQKMSKSHADPRSRITLTDSADEIRSRIKTALTDSIDTVYYDPVARPGVANLFELLSTFGKSGLEAAELGGEGGPFAGASIQELKSAVADAVVKGLAGIRERYLEILAKDDGKYLDEVALEGAVKARANAQKTMEVVRAAIGLS